MTEVYLQKCTGIFGPPGTTLTTTNKTLWIALTKLLKLNSVIHYTARLLRDHKLTENNAIYTEISYFPEFL